MHVRGIWILMAILGWVGSEGRGNGFTLPIPATPPSAEYPIPSSMYGDPQEMAAGRDGNVWFGEGSSKIGKISSSGLITEYTTGISSGVYSITLGPDGNMWFTEQFGNKIGKITPVGFVTEIQLNTLSARGPLGISVGQDGNIWFGESSLGNIGKYDFGTSAVFEYPIPAAMFTSRPSSIAAGPDGNLWFTDTANNRLGRVSTNGTMTMFSVGISPSASPNGITVGPDGNIWFVESSLNKIARLNLSAGLAYGTITEFPGPLTSTSLGKMTAGPDGRLWFSMVSGGRVGAITTNPGNTQTVSEYLSTYPPLGICMGPDRNIWFGEYMASVQSDIGVIDIQALPVTVGISSPPIPMSNSTPVYSAICPSTPQGIANLITALRQYGPRSMMRAFAFDAINKVFCELPDRAPSGGIRVDTGIFIATRVPLSLNFSGTGQPAPFDIVVHPGWNLFGIPPLTEGPRTLTNHRMDQFSVFDGNGAAVTGLARMAAIGSFVYYWDGQAYQNVTTLNSGLAYWIYNNTTMDLTLSRVNDQTGGVVFLSDRESSNGATPTPASSSPGLLPPPFPAFADIQPQHGCGAGGGAAVMIGLLAVLGLRQRRQRLG